MPIDPDFPKNQQVIGKHAHSDGEHYHYVWGPGQNKEAAENEEVKTAYSTRGEQHGSLRGTWYNGCSRLGFLCC